MRKIIAAAFVLLLAVAAHGQPIDDYETILIPLDTGKDTQGPKGSTWRSELLIWNGSSEVLIAIGVCSGEIILTPAPCPSERIDPGQTVSDAFLSDFPMQGTFIYVPKAQLESTHLSLRVRDVSQNAASWGAAIPTPLTSEFKPQITLVDVPVDARFRTTLRVYSRWWASQTVRVRIFAEADAEHPLAERMIELTGLAQPPLNDFEIAPAYAQLNPVDAEVRAAATRVRIEISNMGENVSPPPPPIWAFLSITHDETQQVTIVAPN